MVNCFFAGTIHNVRYGYIVYGIIIFLRNLTSKLKLSGLDIKNYM